MTKLGKIVFTLVVVAVIAFAGYNWWRSISSKQVSEGPPATGGEVSANGISESGESTGKGSDALAEIEFLAPADGVPNLSPLQPYRMKEDGVLLIELSEYAGYAGLIVANGGLEPSDDSFFATNYGFKVKITLSEEDSWDALNRGKMAASATTVDVLAAYGRKMQVVVPVQIGYSRGADGVIVRKEIRKINDLKGKVLAVAPLNETEFFIRYLAQEAGLKVNRLSGLDEPVDAEKVNLVFCEDAFVAADAFLADLEGGGKALAGCVTWAPKTTDVVDASGGAAWQLVDNRNLLIVSDILMFNKAFADENPDKVKGVVHGLLHGNDLVRNNPSAYYQQVADAFKAYEWTAEDAKAEMEKIHFSNLPENLAFFSGAIDAAGSFESIFQSAVLAYGSEIVKNPASPESLVNTQVLESMKQEGHFAGQEISIKPIRTTQGSPVEKDPLLSRDIRFLFQPNSSDLDQAQAVNEEYLQTINQMLRVSPGSIVLLRGHVDDAQIQIFRQQGGEALVRNMALKAMELSKQRANSVRKLMISKYSVPGERIEVIGRGWEEPTSKDSAENRRVEVQWFTVE